MEDDAECSAVEEPAMEPRQGDYLPEFKKLPICNARGEAGFVSAPEGAIIITQCCDLARKGNGHVHLSPVVTLSDDEAAYARSGRTSRFVPIFESSLNRFVDLDVVCSVERKMLEKTRRVRAVMDDQSRQKFGQRVGRRFSRVALPDELNPMMRPLKEIVRSKAGKSSSSFGQVLDHLVYLRLEVKGGWGSTQPCEVTLLLVLEDGRLPVLPAEPVQSLTLAGSAQGKPQIVAELASIILQLNKGDPFLWDAWQRLGDALVRPMRKKRPPTVADITAEVLDENDFSSFRLRRTFPVDFDDLSELVDDGT